MKLSTLLIITYIIIIIIVLLVVFSTTNKRNYWRRFLPLQTCPFGSMTYEVTSTYGDSNVPSDAQGVVSYSLFGNYDKYSVTLLKSISNIQKLMKTWYARVYVGADIPSTTLDSLTSAGAQVYVMGPNAPIGFEGALWRYLPAAENLPFVSLDADDLFDKKVRHNIKKWLASGLPFANFSKHSCIVPLAAGLWSARPFKINGILQSPIPNIASEINGYCELWFGFDEAFLKTYVWPLFKQYGYYQVPSFHLNTLITIGIIILLCIMIYTIYASHKLQKKNER
jgi:hypothetical protein